MKRILYIVFFLSVLNAGAQSNYYNFDRSNVSILEHKLSGPSLINHEMIFPYLGNDTLNAAFEKSGSALFDAFFAKNSFVRSDNLKILALPLVGAGLERHQLDKDTSVFNAAIGAMLQVEWKSKFSFYGDFTANKGAYTPYMMNRFSNSSIFPGFGYRYNATPGKFYYENINFHASWSPHRLINLKAGQGKNFWGHGYRSLFLSDVAKNYPFLKFTTDFWHIKYVALFTQLKDVRYTDGDISKAYTKYATFHFLSWNITKRINLNVFESVIWQAKDTLQNRQFDINYLNPVLFFRPTEYSLGSSDNSIIGFGFNFKVFKKATLYSQFVLDEFVLKQMRDNPGWWANKFGIQVGGKAFDFLGVKGLYCQTEYNVVRPYTYTHGSVYQNYAHFDQPLAHPMGANFRDWVSIVNYSYKWITLTNKVVIANYGLDTNGLNYGGDLYQSYRDRPNDNGNYIGQGNNTELFMLKTGLSFLLMKQNNLRLELGYIYRKTRDNYTSVETPFLYFTLRTQLYSSYNDF